MSFDMRWIGGPIVFAKQRTTVWIFHNLVIIILMDPRSDSNYLVSHPSFLYLPLIHISLLLGISLMPRTLNNTRVPIVFCSVKKSEKEPLPSFPHQSLLLRSYCLMPHVSYICIERVLIFMLFTISNTPEFSIW